MPHILRENVEMKQNCKLVFQRNVATIVLFKIAFLVTKNELIQATSACQWLKSKPAKVLVKKS